MGRGSSIGIGALAAVALGNLALWIAARPVGEPTGRYVGEFCGAEAVVLLSCALVLATLIPSIERAFGGLDRVAVWHRRVATTGVLLLVPHLALVGSPADPYATSLGKALGDVAVIGLLFLTVWALAPRLRAARWPGLIRRLARATYERWLTAHRLTGLFVGAAVAHGAIVGPSLHRSTLLQVSVLAVGGVGIIAYAYRELFARFVVPIFDYTVASVRRLNDTTLEVGLDPVRGPVPFTAGQFVFIAIGGSGGWQRHPFSVSSAPSDRRLKLSIKALGDYTRDLYDSLRPGLPAKLAGPFGGFDYRQGGDDQIWIAGGIGITPFISWIRSLDEAFTRNVDFYYAVRQEGDALYVDELDAAVARHPSLRMHIVCSDRDGRLSADDVLPEGAAGMQRWIFMCGPPPMMRALDKGFRRLGVPAGRIRWEQFEVR
jgi:predicted ferric reductase